MAARRLWKGWQRSFGFVVLIGLAAPPAFAVDPTGSISGTVAFWGDGGGDFDIIVAAHLVLDTPPQGSFHVTAPGGAYTVSALEDGDYYLSAFLDRSGGGGPPMPDEPDTWFDADADGRPDAVTVSGGAAVTGKDINFGFIHVDVDATGDNDGSSWRHAYTDLGPALGAAVSGLEVWVAEGTYTSGTSRASTFTLKNGVKVLGGFAGDEIHDLARKPDLLETILSGDIGTEGLDADNVYHVVTAPAGSNETVVLDGVTVTKGRADAGAPWDRGAGLYAETASPTIVEVVFLDNWAVGAGGGVFAGSGSIRIFNSSFMGNYAGIAGGGFYGGSHDQEIANSVFSGNLSLRGGAIAMAGGSFASRLSNLSISNNDATGEGGGIWQGSGPVASWTLTNSVVWGNTAPANPQIATWVVNVPIVSQSVVQGGYTGTGSTNVLDQDPLFNDADGADNLTGTKDDDLSTQLSSPVIDGGNDSLLASDRPDLDHDVDTTEAVPYDRGNRIREYDVVAKLDTGIGTPPIVDMGAFEGTDEIEVDLAMDKDDGFEDAAPGADITYRITVTNDGSNAINGLGVGDPFPGELENCSWTCSPSGGATCTAGPVMGDLDDTIDLPVGADVVYWIACTIRADATGLLSNTVWSRLPAGYIDLNPGDNYSTDSDILLTPGACGAPENRELDGLEIFGDPIIEACDTISISDVEIEGSVHLVAGGKVEIANGFSVSGELIIEIAVPNSAPSQQWDERQGARPLR